MIEASILPSITKHQKDGHITQLEADKLYESLDRLYDYLYGSIGEFEEEGVKMALNYAVEGKITKARREAKEEAEKIARKEAKLEIKKAIKKEQAMRRKLFKKIIKNMQNNGMSSELIAQIMNISGDKAEKCKTRGR